MFTFQVDYVPVGGAQPRKYQIFVPEAVSNPFQWDENYGRQNSLSGLYQQIASNSHNSITSFNNSATYFYKDSTTSAYNNFVQQFGFTNGIDVSTWNVGDKLVFKSGAYIEVARTTAGGVVLDYKTARGMTAYQNIYVDSDSGADFNRGYRTIPFISSLELTVFTIGYIPLFSYTYQGAKEVGTNGSSPFAYPVSTELAIEFWTGIEPIDTDDPYQDIENSEPSGPAEGVGIPASDPVDFPGLPSFSATDTGFITLFNPTLAQVKALSDYMWNGLFDVNNFKKILADPMDCILGFNMLPVSIPNSGAKDVCIGNIISSVSMNLASSQWVEVDCGQLDLGLPYGSYLDFSPYTKYSIYLPYIGICDLSADDVAGKVLRLKYHVDVLSCSCVAYLKCGDSILYQWTGSCGYSIPVTQNDFSRMIMTVVSIAGAAIGGAVTGGAGAALARAGESAAKNVMGLKPAVHRSGSIGSSAGLMGGQTPYLILEVPKACKPKKQYHYLGYPSFTTVKLADVSGRQDFESVILDGIPCTEEERDMIAAACEGGIYL